MAKPRLAILAFCAALLALGVIALGAFTRLIDAGLGCPDWPGCYGHLLVPWNSDTIQSINEIYPNTPLIAYKAWAEMLHRYCVGGLSLFILAIVAVIGKNTFSVNKQRHSKANFVLACCLILLLFYQILLGQWTVTLKLLPIIVTQHLLGGFGILSILWLLFLINKKKSETNQISGLRILIPFAVVGLIILIIQISLGAWTSTNYASLSCSDFPFCINTETSMSWHFSEAFNLFSPIGVNYEGGVLSEQARQTIQMTHRVGALILTTYLFGFILIGYARLSKSPSLMKTLLMVVGLIGLQICLGISNVLFKLPLVTAIAHNLVAVILLLTMLTFIVQLVNFAGKD